ncbi:Putative L-lactate dehydrogenase operon regulatory protein [Variovorax sp. SRS16]|nr:Putative L-lactate dehydrogenase operon regulatory protein [Variovorax sp. SRS16]
MRYQVHNARQRAAVDTIGVHPPNHPDFAIVHSALTLRESILEKLTSRAWRAGHRLPTERQLSVEFGLGRSTVRRVLAELKDKGFIIQTVGSGTYVADGVGRALSEIAAAAAPMATSPAELMGARLVLEPAIIALVIGNATAADFSRMEECCDKGESASTIEDFEVWDGRLHEAIAAAAHNSFIAAVFQRMNEVRAQSEWGMLKRRSATPERRLDYQREHRELVAALRDRDGIRATQLCIDHLTRVRRNMLGY